MKQYRKKPIVIEAIRWTGENVNEIWSFCGDLEIWRTTKNNIRIPTLEGEMECKEGSWIIKGIKGEYYPCKPDIFEQTYEEA